MNQFDWIPLVGLLFASAAGAQTPQRTAAPADEAPFLAANNAAMTTMMEAHGGEAHRRRRCRLRRHDGPAPSGRDRHGAGGAALGPQRAASPHRPGDHRRAGAGDRGHAAGSRPASAAPCAASPDQTATSRAQPTAPNQTGADAADPARPHATALRMRHDPQLARPLPVRRRPLAGSALPALAGQAPSAPLAPDLPVSHHDRVYAAEQFSNTVSVIDPADNRLLGVIRLGDPQPDQFQPALQGPGAGARHGLLARPPDARGRLDRLQLRDLHRHGDERGKAHDLCGPLAARGLLHARRQGGLGHGARRGLCRGARRRDLRGEDPDQDPERPGHADLLARRQLRLRLLVLQPGNRRGPRRRPPDRRPG